jgi:hypothetical protein
MRSVDFPRKPKQDILLDRSLQRQVKSVKNLKATKRYNKIHALVGEITNFTQKISKNKQTYQVVHDLVEVARRRTNSELIGKSEFSSEELQIRGHLQASNLHIRNYLVLFGNVVSVHNITPVGTRGTLRADFSESRMFGDKIVADAAESKSIYQEVYAQIHWAKIAVMECGILKTTCKVVELALLRSVDVLGKDTSMRLEWVKITCAQRTESRNEYVAFVPVRDAALHSHRSVLGPDNSLICGKILAAASIPDSFKVVYLMSHARDKSTCKAGTANMQMMAKAGSRIRWHVNAGHRICASPLNAIAGNLHLLRFLKKMCCVF